jgi:hypothetical protein
MSQKDVIFMCETVYIAIKIHGFEEAERLENGVGLL